MGVIVKKWKGAWWIFTNHKNKRKAKRIGEGEQGKQKAKAEAAVVRAFLATGGVIGRPEAAPVAAPVQPTLKAYATACLKNYAAVEANHERMNSMTRCCISTYSQRWLRRSWAEMSYASRWVICLCQTSGGVTFKSC